MLKRLFPRLTAEPDRGRQLFERVVAEARQPHWYREGAVPDTMEGRFAMLATVAALVTVRLERAGAAGEQAGVALAERLIESLDSELRQSGLGDPTLGKQVRKLVGAVALRVELWRRALGERRGWHGVVLRSAFRDRPPGEAAVDQVSGGLKALWERLDQAADGAVADGDF